MKINGKLLAPLIEKAQQQKLTHIAIPLSSTLIDKEINVNDENQFILSKKFQIDNETLKEINREDD